MGIARRITRNSTGTSILSWLGAQYIRLIRLTGRWRVVGGEHPQHFWDKGEAFIGCLWHGRLMMMPKIWLSKSRMHVLISRHRDGRMISRTIGHFGIDTIAGSSSKGGTSAFRAILRALAAGESVCFTPDGPRGPRQRMRSGVVATASRTGRPILCATYSTTRRRLLSSWDRFMVPLPFGRGVFVWSEPIYVPDGADSETLEKARRRVEERLNQITREADRLCGWPAMEPAADEATGFTGAATAGGQ